MSAAADADIAVTAAPAQVDIAIVGGGMVGASLGLALAGTRRSVALIEAVSVNSTAQPSFDDRTTALGNGARLVLETLGVWTRIAERAAPIRHIHVSDAGRFGFARLDAQAEGLDAFGYSVSNRHMGQVLWDALGRVADLRILAPARVETLAFDADRAQLGIRDARGRHRQLGARLVVAADGAQSLVKVAAGIETESTSYDQLAVIANVGTDRSAQGIAYERFSADGLIALLPLFDGDYTVVWTLPPATAAELCACSDGAFCMRLQRAFGWRAGTILRAGRRTSYPLALTRALEAVAQRTVVVGNAAQALHPVAAQGFNLGLRDAALLAEMLVGDGDPGDAALLAQFGRRRAADRRGMIRFTDGLVKIFGDRRGGVGALRDLGLLLFDVLPPAKHALSRLSWGFGAGRARLTRGLPLA